MKKLTLVTLVIGAAAVVAYAAVVISSLEVQEDLVEEMEEHTDAVDDEDLLDHHI